MWFMEQKKATLKILKASNYEPSIFSVYFFQKHLYLVSGRTARMSDYLWGLVLEKLKFITILLDLFSANILATSNDYIKNKVVYFCC